MTIVLPALLMLMQVGIDPNGGRVPGIPEELRNRPPRTSSVAQPSARTPAIATCLATAEADPAKGRGLAEEWVARTRGGQRAAGRHCLGVAASNGGDWPAAAAAFRAAREEADDPRFRARMGLLAGTALLAQEQPAEALRTLDAAQADAAGDTALRGELAIERAVALVAMQREAEAATALGDARALLPASTDAWLLSATLARRLNRLAEAQGHIERAAALDPRDPAIGLEAGVIAALAGQDEAARKSFRSVIAAGPETAEAARAQSYLDQLGR